MFYYFIENNQEVFEREELVDALIFPQYIRLTAEQETYHLDHPDALRKEIENLGPLDPDDIDIEKLRQEVLKAIDAYDTSSAVNEFFINGIGIWLDKGTRISLDFTIDIEAKTGASESTLWYGNICFTLPISTIKVLLQSVELYAKACYDNTAEHKANVSKLTTIEELEKYDYTVGYPEKVSFIV